MSEKFEVDLMKNRVKTIEEKLSWVRMIEFRKSKESEDRRTKRGKLMLGMVGIIKQ